MDCRTFVDTMSMASLRSQSSCESPNLDEWVAVKKNVFDDKFDQVDGKNVKFTVKWIEKHGAYEITMNEAAHVKEKVVQLTAKEIKNIHGMIVLMYPQIRDCLPDLPKPSIFSKAKVSEQVCIKLERYLESVNNMCGNKLLFATFFEDAENDEYLCDLYQESMSELKLQTFEQGLSKADINLREILDMRKKSANMLQLSTIYPLENDAVVSLLNAMAQYYEFQMQPFIDLKELTHHKLKELDIPKSDSHVVREYQEQLMSAEDSVLDIQHEYFSKRVKLLSEQLGRMKEDKENYGKSAFEVYGLDVLHTLELSVSMEQLALLKCEKCKFQHDAIKMQHQMLMIPSDKMQKELKRLENEVVTKQIKLYDIKLDILKEEENVINCKLTIIYKELSDRKSEGIFHDAVENVEDAPDDEDIVAKNENVIKFKQQLSKVYQQRAKLRTRKNAYVSEHKRKQKQAEEKLKQYEDHHDKGHLSNLSERKKGSTLSSEAVQQERRKTLQRLKNYRMKFGKKKDQQSRQLPVKNQLPPPPSEINEECYDEVTQNLPLPNPPKCATKSSPKQKKRPSKNKSEAHRSSQDVTQLPAETIFPPPPSSASTIPPPPPTFLPPPPISTIPPPLPPVISSIPPPPPPPISSIPPPPPPPPPPTAAAPSTIIVKRNEKSDEKVGQQNTPSSASATENIGIQLNDILAAKQKLKNRSNSVMQDVMDAELEMKMSETKGSVSQSDLLLATLSKIRNITVNDSSDDEDSKFSDFE